MTTLNYDLKFLESAAEELKTYLFSDDVYWPLGVNAPEGASPYPRMTLGWVMLFARRAQNKSAEDPDAADLLARIETVQSQWRAAWARKAVHEFAARLKLWQNYLNEYRSNPGAHATNYHYEVKRRLLLELLLPVAKDLSPEQIELLRSLDLALRGHLIPGDFVGDPEDAGAFPPGKFWFLYGSLKS